MEKKISKQSEGLVTSLWNKYCADLFFRTTCHIILLQVILTILISVGLWFMMQYLVRETSESLMSTFMQMLQGQNVTGESVSRNLEAVRLSQYWQITIITAAVILSFGFLMVYITLRPARLSLERKRRFIGNISHELRTPLSVIRTNTDISLLDAELPPKVRKRLQRNIAEFDRITEIMNNILGLSNLMQDQHLHFEEVDLYHIAQKAISSLEETSDRKDVTIVIESHAHQDVLGNPSALEQAVFNLLKNAIAHVDTHGVVTVAIEAAPDGKYINLSVRDTGSGIAHEDLFHVLEPFYRTRHSKKFRKGQGLGLAIVNEIVQMHRGKIKIKSALGHGTIVTLSIKRSVEAEAMPEPIQEPDMEEVSMDFSRRILQ